MQPEVLTQSTCTTTFRSPNKASRYLKKFLRNILVTRAKNTISVCHMLGIKDYFTSGL